MIECALIVFDQRETNEQTDGLTQFAGAMRCYFIMRIVFSLSLSHSLFFCVCLT